MSIKTKLVARCLLSALFILPGVQQAYAADDLRVNLIATIDNGPAMEDVKWTVYRTDTNTAVKSAKNHSTHVLLPAGSYRAVATLTSSDNKTVVRSRRFHVRTPDSKIVVPMD